VVASLMRVGGGGGEQKGQNLFIKEWAACTKVVSDKKKRARLQGIGGEYTVKGLLLLNRQKKGGRAARTWRNERKSLRKQLQSATEI